MWCGVHNSVFILAFGMPLFVCGTHLHSGVAFENGVRMVMFRCVTVALALPVFLNVHHIQRFGPGHTSSDLSSPAESALHT